MRLLCPFCQKVVEIKDDMAGKAVNCLHCSQAFQAPQLYVTPTVTPIAPPSSHGVYPVVGEQQTRQMPMVQPVIPQMPPSTVGPGAATIPVQVTPVTSAPSVPLLPPVDGSFPSLPSQPSINIVTPGPTAAVTGLHDGPTAFHSLAIQPRVLSWIPAIAMFFLFVLSFFSWVGAYPAGYAAYTQNAWRALFASFGKDLVAEDVFKLETKLKEVITTDWLMLLYLPLLLLGLLLAWIGPIRDLLKLKLPPVVERIWLYRPALLAVVAVFSLLIVSFQWTRTFGIERAITEIATKDHLEAKANAKTDEQKQRWEMRVAQDVGAYELQTTTWLRMVWLLHVLVGLAVALEAVIALRGKQLPIRIGVEW